MSAAFNLYTRAALSENPIIYGTPSAALYSSPLSIEAVNASSSASSSASDAEVFVFQTEAEARAKARALGSGWYVVYNYNTNQWIVRHNTGVAAAVDDVMSGDFLWKWLKLPQIVVLIAGLALIGLSIYAWLNATTFESVIKQFTSSYKRGFK